MKLNKKISKQFRGGAYSIVVSLIVLALVFLVNLIVGQLPKGVLQYDTTNKGLYTLSEQSVEIVKGLNEDVTMYIICQPGSEDDRVYKLVERYADLNDKITVKHVDPVLEPTFTSRYTEGTVENNSIIVESMRRSTVIYNKDIYTYMYDDYYDTSYEAFSGEAVITSAIDYVTAEDMPKLYMLTGHNEPTLSSEIIDGVGRENIIFDSISLVGNEIPADTACLFINAPRVDLSAEETAKIKSYLSDGGRMMLVTDYQQTAMPNLESIMADYGVAPIDGIVVEGDMSKVISGYNHYIMPDFGSHVIVDPLKENNSKVLMPVSFGIETASELRSSLTVTPLLITSDSAYSKTAGADMTTYEKESGDLDGPFDVAVAIEEAYGDQSTKIVWFTNSNFLVKEVDEAVSGGNSDIFLNSLGWMCERDNGISIRAKSLAMDYLTIDGASASRFSIITIGVLPALIIVAGIVVIIRRRKKI
ncbi:MAG: GldG family protein [Lachnospiraceae bacterium]|nr:GldG family protein [Candidatus Equihabitans merdae]